LTKTSRGVNGFVRYLYLADEPSGSPRNFLAATAEFVNPSRESDIHALGILVPPGNTRFGLLPLSQTPLRSRRPHPNPDKTEKIFGYKAIIATFVKPQLGIEFPVGSVTIAGNAEEIALSLPGTDPPLSFHRSPDSSDGRQI
jgi:hypothetical protein